MKKITFLISMIAATLMVASCSKDDGDTIDNPVVTDEQNETEVVNNIVPQTKQTRPIVIKAQSGATISKVATTDGYKFTFSDGDKLVLTDGTTTYATLGLDGGAGEASATFKGEISTGADGKSIYATIDGQSVLTEVKTSTTSLADVVQSNCYFKSETFTYNASGELSVTLNDQNAYLVFNLADGQKKVNIGGEKDWYEVSGGHCCAAVPAGEVTGRFFGTKTAESGKIYTITRTDVVDLGPTFSVLWKTTNETDGTVSSSYTGTEAAYSGEKYYDWANACAFGRINESNEYVAGSADPFRLPTKAELEALGTGTWTTQNSVNGREFSTDYGSVFFPAAGLYGGVRAGREGYYWSGESDDDYDAYILLFGGGYAGVDPYDVDGKFSVRLVRGL